MTKEQNDFFDRVARRAFENACDLNNEARLLFNYGHYARTAALSITSMEELVKAAAYILASIGEIDPALLKHKENGRYRYVLKSHRTKQKLFGLLHASALVSNEYLKGVLAGKTPEEAKRPLKTLHLDRKMKAFEALEEYRLAALYVGVEEDKPLETPKQGFDRENSETLLGLSTELLPLWRFIFDNPKKKWLPILREISANAKLQPVTFD